MADSGTYDLILDSVETLIPTIYLLFNNKVITFFKKYRYYFKLMMLLGLSARVFYRIKYLDIKDETINLKYKFMTQIFNILFLAFILFKDNIEEEVKEIKDEMKKEK